MYSRIFKPNCGQQEQTISISEDVDEQCDYTNTIYTTNMDEGEENKYVECDVNVTSVNNK